MHPTIVVPVLVALGRGTPLACSAALRLKLLKSNPGMAAVVVEGPRVKALLGKRSTAYEAREGRSDGKRGERTRTSTLEVWKGWKSSCKLSVRLS